MANDARTQSLVAVERDAANARASHRLHGLNLPEHHYLRFVIVSRRYRRNLRSPSHSTRPVASLGGGDPPLPLGCGFSVSVVVGVGIPQVSAESAASWFDFGGFLWALLLGAVVLILLAIIVGCSPRLGRKKRSRAVKGDSRMRTDT